MWKRALLSPPNPTEADKIKARGYPTDVCNKQLNRIYIIYKKLENKEPSQDLKGVFKSVRTECELKGLKEILNILDNNFCNHNNFREAY